MLPINYHYFRNMAIQLKLDIELVPSTSWYKNLRNKIGREKWDIIRSNIYKKYNKCAICLFSGKLHCHEIWLYDDINHIQRLKGFIDLCEWCHWVKHIGLAGIRAEEGLLDYETVVKHFMKVNQCDRKTFEDHRDRAFEKWKERSKHRWELELGEYKKYLVSQEYTLF